MSSELTSRQRSHLKRLAHPLKPILQIGKEGITDSALSSVEDAFRRRELLKIKVQNTAPVDVDEAAGVLSERVDGVVVVQTIGRTAVLYRPHPDDPEIRLPR